MDLQIQATVLDIRLANEEFRMVLFHQKPIDD